MPCAVLRACLNLTTFIRWWLHSSQPANSEALIAILHSHACLWRELLFFNRSKWGQLLRTQLESLDVDSSLSVDVWQRAALYWIVHVVRHRRYGGECILLRRRALNHVSRIIDPDGATQQRFFSHIRLGRVHRLHIAPRLAGWVILPVSIASSEKDLRVQRETAMIHSCKLELNPPFIEHLPPPDGSHVNRKRASGASILLQQETRPLKRRLLDRDRNGHVLYIASPATTPHAAPSIFCELEAARLALCGHRADLTMSQAQKVILKASPFGYALVYKRALSREEGWRRARGVAFLRIASRIRKDFVKPICSLHWSLPWIGPDEAHAKLLIRLCVREILCITKSTGAYLPLSRRAKVTITWSAAPSLATLLSPRSDLRRRLDDPCTYSCQCSDLPPSWPRLLTDWGPHVVCEGRDAPWPAHLKDVFRYLPATTRMPPSEKEIACAVADHIDRFIARGRLARAVAVDCRLTGEKLSHQLCAILAKVDTCGCQHPQVGKRPTHLSLRPRTRETRLFLPCRHVERGLEVLLLRAICHR